MKAFESAQTIKARRNHLAFALLAFLMPIGSAQLPEPERMFVASLFAAPSWREMNPEIILGDEGVLAIGKGLSELPTETVREVLIAYVERVTEMPINEQYDHLGKIYILNRILFDVPNWIDRESWKPFGGWNVPIVDGRVNAVFPFDLMPNGSIRFAYSEPRYGGPPYRALEEFDHFSVTYPRRKLIQE